MAALQSSTETQSQCLRKPTESLTTGLHTFFSNSLSAREPVLCMTCCQLLQAIIYYYYHMPVHFIYNKQESAEVGVWSCRAKSGCFGDKNPPLKY